MSRISLKVHLIEGGIRVVFPLLGIFFLVAGIFGAISFGVQPLYEAMQTRQWVEVPAVLESVRIEPPDILHNRPLPALMVRFRYQHGSKEYVGSRYDLHQGAERRGVVEANYRELNASQAVTAWVNPQMPSQALLVRSLSLPLLAMSVPFAALALLGGVLLLGGMVAWNQAPAHVRARRREHPEP